MRTLTGWAQILSFIAVVVLLWAILVFAGIGVVDMMH